MKPKAKTQISGVLASVFVLIFFQLPFAPSSSAALYDSFPATQSISYPTGYTDGEGRNITQAYWAYDGTYYFFRFDPFGPFNNNRNYGFYFEPDGNLNTFVADFSTDTAAYMAYILEWKEVTFTKFPSDLGTWGGATSNMGGNLKDIMTSIPSAVWLFALAALVLVVLKRRRPTS